jgi:PAS domain S-box-containing protein
MSERSRAPDLGSGREVEEGLGDPFTAAFRTTRMAMAITDPRQPDNPIVFVNDAFLNLTGYPREEVLGRNCRFLQGPDTDRGEVARIGQALAAGQGVEVEILNYRRDGAPFWNRLLVNPIHDEAGTLLYFFSSQLDVTDRRRAQAELERTRDTLEQEVRRRTSDLEAALEQKTALLHEVDHRVKNNLQIVSSLILLKARRIREKAAQRVLYNMAERISALSTVHRLLYSTGDVSRFDLREFIADLSDDLMAAADPKRIELALSLDPVGIAPAKAAPLGLLVNELVTNALRHAFPGERRGRLSIALKGVDGEARIVVEDDGVGMGQAEPAEEGFGRTLAEMLARQIKADLTWEDAQPGTRAVVRLPLEAEEGR